MHAEEEAANDVIRNDEYLMSMYPKIKAIPDYLKKKIEIKENQRLT